MSGDASTKPIRDVAAVMIQRADGRVLLLQRGATAPTFPNHWGVVTGLVEAGETPAEAALRELGEEAGLTGEIVRAGEAFQVDIGASIVRVWPFLCAVDPNAAIVLGDENQRYEWVALDAVSQRATIPQIEQDFRAVGLL